MRRALDGEDGRHVGLSETRPEPVLGRIPAPRIDTPPGARLLFSRARMRGSNAIDAVEFTARCPACGIDCEWSERREDTRLLTAVLCSCG